MLVKIFFKFFVDFRKYCKWQSIFMTVQHLSLRAFGTVLNLIYLLNDEMSFLGKLSLLDCWRRSSEDHLCKFKQNLEEIKQKDVNSDFPDFSSRPKNLKKKK